MSKKLKNKHSNKILKRKARSHDDQSSLYFISKKNTFLRQQIELSQLKGLIPNLKTLKINAENFKEGTDNKIEDLEKLIIERLFNIIKENKNISHKINKIIQSIIASFIPGDTENEIITNLQNILSNKEITYDELVSNPLQYVDEIKLDKLINDNLSYIKFNYLISNKKIKRSYERLVPRILLYEATELLGIKPNNEEITKILNKINRFNIIFVDFEKQAIDWFKEKLILEVKNIADMANANNEVNTELEIQAHVPTNMESTFKEDSNGSNMVVNTDSKRSKIKIENYVKKIETIVFNKEFTEENLSYLVTTLKQLEEWIEDPNITVEEQTQYNINQLKSRIQNVMQNYITFKQHKLSNDLATLSTYDSSNTISALYDDQIIDCNQAQLLSNNDWDQRYASIAHLIYQIVYERKQQILHTSAIDVISELTSFYNFDLGKLNQWKNEISELSHELGNLVEYGEYLEKIDTLQAFATFYEYGKSYYEKREALISKIQSLQEIMNKYGESLDNIMLSIDKIRLVELRDKLRKTGEDYQELDSELMSFNEKDIETFIPAINKMNAQVDELERFLNEIDTWMPIYEQYMQDFNDFKTSHPTTPGPDQFIEFNAYQLDQLKKQEVLSANDPKLNKQIHKKIHLLQDSIASHGKDTFVIVSDWFFSPKDIYPIIHNFKNRLIKIAGHNVADKFEQDIEILFESNNYIEASSAISYITASAAVMVDDKAAQILKKLYSKYTKQLIILTATDNSILHNLVDEYQTSAGLNSLEQSSLNEEFLLKSYQRIYNMILNDFEHTIDTRLLNKINEFTIETVFNKIDHLKENEAFVFDKTNFITLCDQLKEFNAHLTITLNKICVLYEQIEALNVTLSKVDNSDINIESLKNFITQRLNANQFQHMKFLLDKLMEGEYITDNHFNIDFIQFIKNVVSLPTKINAIFNKIHLQDSSIISPFSIENQTELADKISQLLQTCVNISLKNELMSIQQILDQNINTIANGLKIERICTTNIAFSQENVFKVIIEHPAILQSIITAFVKATQNQIKVSSSISLEQISELNNLVPTYQKAIDQFGQVCIESSLNPENNQALIKLQVLSKSISRLSMKFAILSKLNDMVNTVHPDDLPLAVRSKFNSLSEALNLFLQKLSIITSAIKDLEQVQIDPQAIFLSRLSKGDFFNLHDRESLYYATYGIYGFVSGLKILDAILPHFDNYTQSQQQECLLFIYHYLDLDTKNQLIPLKIDKSVFIERLDKFCQDILTQRHKTKEPKTDSSIDIQIERILDLLINKVDDKRNACLNYFNELSSGNIPHNELVKRINTINDDFRKNSSNIAVIDENLMEISQILLSPNFYISEAEAEAILIFCDNIDTLDQFVGVSTQFRREVENRIEPFRGDIYHNSTQVDERPSVFNLNKILKHITNAQMSASQYEQYVKKVVDAIEIGFRSRFVEIDNSEFINAAWLEDNQRLARSLLPLAPHVRLYSHYLNLVTHFFTLMIFFEIKDDTLQRRENIHEIKRLLEFIEKAIIYALDKGAHSTAVALEAVLTSSQVQRLKLSNNEYKQIHAQYFDNKKAHDNAVPFLGSLQSEIAKLYSRQTTDEFERLVKFGKILHKINLLKRQLQIDTQYSDLTLQMKLVMNNASVLLEPILQTDILIDEKALHDMTEEVSYYVKPDRYEVRSIDKFHSIDALKERLSYWYNRSEDFHVLETPPQKHIVKYMLSYIESHNSINHFKTCMDILELIHNIDASSHREYKDYDADLLKILSFYKNRIAIELKNEELKDYTQIDEFFNIFSLNHKIKMIKDTPASSLNPFSPIQSLHDVIKSINRLHQRYNMLKSQRKQFLEQITYTQLLHDILEGNAPQSILPSAKTDEESEIHTDSLLPDTEFDVPDEPEHPDKIGGINKTMSFKPAPKQRSLLEVLETDDIIMDFLEAFPWAATIDTLEKLQDIELDSSINLLDTEVNLPAKTQVNIMTYILVSLDILGKICGHHGELAVQNYMHIKKIINGLTNMASMLKNPDIYLDIHFNNKVIELLESIVQDNKQYYYMLLHPDPSLPVANNKDMSTFCHINESLSHKLKDVEYTQSYLTPLKTNSQQLIKLISPTSVAQFQSDAASH